MSRTIRRAKHLFIMSLFVIAAAMLPARKAHAGIPVIDGTNLVQSIMTALQTLQSNLNEVTQIANQVTSLQHEVQNLQQLPASVANGLLNQYVSQYTQLANNFNTINGLGASIGNLTARYQAAFPNRSLGAAVAPNDVLLQVQGYLTQARATMQGVYRQSGQVMQALPQASSQISTILGQSQASNGALDGIQANTQMNGQVANQLVNLNAQIATMFQAQTDVMAQQQQMMDVGRRRAVDARVDFVTNSTQPPAAYLPALH